MKNNQKSFTLAETMIVVAVLGLIAVLVVPSVIRRHIEVSNRAKIKKNMAAYDFIINKMVLESDTRDALALQSWAGNAENGCENSTTYFKKSEGSGCRFKTTDGVWWDISDVMNPTIALKEEDLDNENFETSFKQVADFDNQGILRVNDLTYEINNSSGDNLKDVVKIYSYTSGKAPDEIIPTGSLSFLKLFGYNLSADSYDIIYDSQGRITKLTEKCQYDPEVCSNINMGGYNILYDDANNKVTISDFFGHVSPSTVFTSKTYSTLSDEIVQKVLSSYGQYTVSNYNNDNTVTRTATNPNTDKTIYKFTYNKTTQKYTEYYAYGDEGNLLGSCTGSECDSIDLPPFKD